MARKGSKAWLREQGFVAGWEAAKEGRGGPIVLLNTEYDNAALAGFNEAIAAGIGGYTLHAGREIRKHGKPVIDVVLYCDPVSGNPGMRPAACDDLARRIVALLNEHGDK